MSDTPVKFTGSIPENYDKYLGPLFFHHHAADIARRVTVPAAGRVLEVACGTGIVTEALREHLSDDIEVVATDLSQPMLDFALAKRGNLKNVSFRQADAQDLPFEDAAFDAVVSQFAIMFFPDKAKGMAEAARVLKPGGMGIISVWDSLAQNRFVAVAQEALETFFPTDPPRFLPMPFSCYERDMLGELMEGAGLTNIEIDEVSSVRDVPSAEDVARGLVTGNPNILEIEARLREGPDEVVASVAAALRAEFGDAPIRLRMQAIVISGVKP